MWLLWTLACLVPFSILMEAAKASHTTVAVLQQNIILPCTYKIHNPSNVNNVLVYWQIPGNPTSLVYFLNYEKKEDLSRQSSAYHNRARLFMNHLEQGNFSLMLSHVHMQDEAQYECYVHRRNGGTQLENTVHLQVSASYREPIIKSSVTGSNGARTISCSSNGGYPEASVHWTMDGKPITIDPSDVKTDAIQDPTKKTYAVISTLTIQASDSVIGCIIENRRLRENKSASETSQYTGRRLPSRGVPTHGCPAVSICLLALWLGWQF